MLNDYKGEKPNNVITKEQHEKRPFYKKVSFWVLSALGLFFGGCSVYGLVLGYQYVQAVTQAAHIIADAKSNDDVSSLVSKPKRFNAVSDLGHDVASVDLGYFNWWHINASGNSAGRWICICNFVDASPNNSLTGDFFADFYAPVPWRTITDTSIDNTIAVSSSNNTTYIGIHDDSAYDFTPEQFKAYVTGRYFYFRPNANWTGLNLYDQGYSDGSDAINLPQSVKVLLPEGNQYSVQYKSYLDGVADREGQLASSQFGGAYTSFDRSRNQKLRIDLTLPSGSRAFFLYSPSWTSSYPTDENYSLRQSWAVSGVTYLPTWVTNPQIYVGVTSADVPDLTYQTISVAFDVDHWGDIKVGAYSQGYNDGYQAGEENPTAYDSGYDAGYEQGYDDGHTIGVAQGESQAVSGQKALVSMFVTAFQQPFDQIYRFLNFNVLGLNILALFTALLTLSIGIIIIKKVI